MRVVVVMAGGSGERFWPMSRQDRPKQLLRLTSERTMLEETVRRAEAVPGVEAVYVVAGPELTPRLRETLRSLPEDRFLVEPEGRNTAPCLALAVALLARRHGPETAMGVLSADHRIADVESFAGAADLAFETAEREDALVTLGIRPTHPNTGFGYLETGPVRRETERGSLHDVLAFREKPDQETAEQYCASGRHLWNSGMFFWRAEIALRAFRETAPEYAEGMETIVEAGDAQGVVRRVFSEWPRQSIDYAVMEKAPNVVAVAGRFDWEDVGAWDALARIEKPDAEGNVVRGEAVLLDAANCIVANEPPAGEGPTPLVALLGVEDLVVVQSGGAILVTRRDRAQDVKKMVEHLRERGCEEHL